MHSAVALVPRGDERDGHEHGCEPNHGEGETIQSDPPVDAIANLWHPRIFEVHGILIAPEVAEIEPIHRTEHHQGRDGQRYRGDGKRRPSDVDAHVHVLWQARRDAEHDQRRENGQTDHREGDQIGSDDIAPCHIGYLELTDQEGSEHQREQPHQTDHTDQVESLRASRRFAHATTPQTNPKSTSVPTAAIMM